MTDRITISRELLEHALSEQDSIGRTLAQRELRALLSAPSAELAEFRCAVEHVTEDGKTTRSFSSSAGWAMVHKERLMDLETAEESLGRLREELAKARGLLEIARLRYATDCPAHSDEMKLIDTWLEANKP